MRTERAQLSPDGGDQEVFLEGAWLPHLLQITDSLFPTGAYAHSFGLEGLVQTEGVETVDGLRVVLQEMILPTLRRVELPWIAMSYRAAAEERWADLAGLSERYGAMRGSRELREASVKLGAQRLDLLRKLIPDPRWSILEDALIGRNAEPHFPIVQALQSVVAGIPLRAALCAAYYSGVTGVLSASMKLMRIGQGAVQGLLTEMLKQCPEAVKEAEALSEEEMGWFNPVLDIASARHEDAYTRVFIS